jgi:hypothetical protein
MRTWLLAAMFVSLSVVWLGFTHLQGRFFILAAPIAGLMLATARPRGAAAVGLCAIIIVSGVIGFIRVDGELRRMLNTDVIAFGDDVLKVRDLLGRTRVNEAINPEPVGALRGDATVFSLLHLDVLRQLPSPDVDVALVGDAKAFWYPMPMSHLRYRTVFDVDAQPGESAIDAWARERSPGTTWLVVDPNELQRFAATYRAIPPLPPEYSGGKESFVVRPGTPQPTITPSR